MTETCCVTALRYRSRTQSKSFPQRKVFTQRVDYNCGSSVSLGIRASENITHSYSAALITVKADQVQYLIALSFPAIFITIDEDPATIQRV